MNYEELLKRHKVIFANRYESTKYNKDTFKRWKQERDNLESQINNLGDDLTRDDFERVEKLINDWEMLSLRISSVYFNRLTRDELGALYKAGGKEDMTEINRVLAEIDERLKMEESGEHDYDDSIKSDIF